MVKVQDLLPGDELECWMRLGFAVKPAITGAGKPYYKVPSKAARARNGDLTRFRGWVISNSPDDCHLVLEIAPFNSWQQPLSSQHRRCTIVYALFQRLRRLSKYSHAAMPEVPASFAGKGYKRPGSIDAFGGTAFRPYRTIEEVKLL